MIVRANRLPVTCLAVTGCSYSLAPSATVAQPPVTTAAAAASTDEVSRLRKVRYVFFIHFSFSCICVDDTNHGSLLLMIFRLLTTFDLIVLYTGANGEKV